MLLWTTSLCWYIDTCSIVDITLQVDLSCLRGRGMQPEEKSLPEASTVVTPVYDEQLLSQLVSILYFPSSSKM